MTSESDYEDENVPGSGDTVHVVTFFQRKKGPKHQILYRIVLSQNQFDLLMSDRFHRLHLTSGGSSQAENFCLRKPLQKLELMIEDRKFSGYDPILIFEFLTRILEAMIH